jgi:methyl-accepting chemotaxis protein
MEVVVKSVRLVTDLVADIMAANHEQSAGVDQVSRVVCDMDSVTQRDSAMAQQLIEVTSELRFQSGRVLEAISGFEAGMGAGGDVVGERMAKASPSERAGFVEPLSTEWAA